MIAEWIGRGGRVAVVEQISPVELARRLAASAPPLLLDVRSPEEFARDGHIAGSRLLPLSSLAQRMDEVPRGRMVVVICRSGARSAAVCELLATRGYEGIANLRGGIQAWGLLGLPLQ